MRLFVRSAAALSLCSIAAPCAADAAPTALAAPAASVFSPIAIGLHSGIEVPGGAINGGNDIQNEVTYAVPLGIDIGYRVVPRLQIGLYGQYGFAKARSTECIGACGTSLREAYDVRFGANAEYFFESQSRWTPWLGLGVGYEILGLEATTVVGTYNERWRGFEFVRLTFGDDFELADHLWVGPFVGLSFGAYNRLLTSRYPEIPVSQTAISDDGGGGVALHVWMTLGVCMTIAPLR